MELAITDQVAKAFENTFGKRLVFRPDLKREDSAVWDSLHHLTLVVNLEKQFRVRFDGASITMMISIASIIEQVQKRIPQ